MFDPCKQLKKGQSPGSPLHPSCPPPAVALVARRPILTHVFLATTQTVGQHHKKVLDALPR
jgi:hypothetical protein